MNNGNDGPIRKRIVKQHQDMAEDNTTPLTRFEIYQFDEESEQEQIVGVAMSGFHPTPGTIIQLVAKSTALANEFLQRMFFVEQSVTVLFDQTKGFPDMGTNIVKLVVRPMGQTHRIAAHDLIAPKPRDFSEKEKAEISAEMFSTEMDPNDT